MQCPICLSPMIEKQGKYGVYMDCSNPHCKFTKSVEGLFQKPNKIAKSEGNAK